MPVPALWKEMLIIPTNKKVESDEIECSGKETIVLTKFIVSSLLCYILLRKGLVHLAVCGHGQK